MFKFFALLLVIGVVASEEIQLLNYNNNMDDYINQNRQQYAQNIRDYDQRIEAFKQSYTATLAVIPKRLDMLVESIRQTEKRLNTLEILNQNCVQKYRSKMPNVWNTQQQINVCWNTADGQVNRLVVDALNTRTSLDNYYKYEFENRLNRCKVQSGDYNKCVSDAITNANVYTANNRKTFDSQMQSAQTRANANFDTAFRCSYTAQNQASSSLAEVNLLTNRCLEGLEDCKPCSNQGYSCSKVSYLQRYEVDYNNPLMRNVFYGRYDVTDCLLLNILN